ncbi:MAG: DUF2059 domain-containing protein [Candidatus Zixiibacteriota bacterium]
MKRLLTIVFACILFTGLSAGQDTKSPEHPIDPAFKADIVKYLKVTGRERTVKEGVESWLIPYKAQNPNVPDELWRNFIDIQFDEFLFKVVPVFAKHYTHQEIKDLIAFFESSIGQKWMSLGMKIRQDVEESYGNWNDEIELRLKLELSRAGY